MRIVVLTGAGISAESGLGTFRDKDGLWTRVDLNEVATPEGYARNPQKVLDFYNMRRQGVIEAQPNGAHRALARLEERLGDALTLVTQNVDDLHERAGSAHVIHMHGQLLSALCGACAHSWPWPGPMRLQDACPACAAPGRVRPDVVWFGEMPFRMEEIYERIAEADIFAAIGTSGQVYPAAGFVMDAKLAGAETVEINLERTDSSGQFDRHVLGPASQAVPRWVDEVLGGAG
jgi:NAD-dependent deacetylase